MKHTYAYNIKQQILNAGYSIIKDEKESRWKIVDDVLTSSHVMANKSLGDLMCKAAKEFNLE